MGGGNIYYATCNKRFIKEKKELIEKYDYHCKTIKELEK